MKQGTHALLYFRATKPLYPQYHFGMEIFYSTHASFVVKKGAPFKVVITEKCAHLTVSIQFPCLGRVLSPFSPILRS